MLDRMNENGALEELIRKELLYGIKTNGNHHSDHEAWAVLQEEVDELVEACNWVSVESENYWIYLKNRFANTDKHEKLSQIYDRAILAACEAIQVAAMALKADRVDNKGGG